MKGKIKKVLKKLGEIKIQIRCDKEVSQYNRELRGEGNIIGYYEKPKDPVVKGTGLSIEEPRKHTFL